MNSVAEGDMWDMWLVGGAVWEHLYMLCPSNPKYPWGIPHAMVRDCILSKPARYSDDCVRLR